MAVPAEAVLSPILRKVDLFLKELAKPPENQRGDHKVLHTVDDEQANKNRFVELYVRHQTLNLLANLKDGQLPVIENDSDMEFQATIACDEAAWIDYQEGEARIQTIIHSLGSQLTELSDLRSSLTQKLDGLQEKKKLAEAEDSEMKMEEKLNRVVALREQYIIALRKHKVLLDDTIVKTNGLNTKLSQAREKLDHQQEWTKELHRIESLLGFRLLTCSAEHLSVEAFTPLGTSTKLYLSLEKDGRVRDITSDNTTLNLSDVHVKCGTCRPDIPSVLLTVLQQLRQQ